ncbi:hypothetical protein FOCC_FOCC013691 [Frankliniella occidentalis]|nr:hypothetical protein FOCC_FOCC013691 [Frankliniella occidentalis]
MTSHIMVAALIHSESVEQCLPSILVLVEQSFICRIQKARNFYMKPVSNFNGSSIELQRLLRTACLPSWRWWSDPVSVESM